MITDQTFTRRQVLQGTTRFGLTLTLAAVLGASPRPTQAQQAPQFLSSHGIDILREHDVQHWIGTGLGGLWVAGQFLNSFAHNLVFENLPHELQQKYRLAGGEYKSLPAAREIWETIPASIRAEGPEALWRFHKGKDWSHIVPRSWGGPVHNGIWWCSPCNRSLGPRPMAPADIASAKALLQFEGMKSVISQTIKGSVKGGMLGVVVGGLLAILAHGLDHAERKITWQEMVAKTVKSSIAAGSVGFTITGIIVGLSLVFPFLIPIFSPLLIILQAVGLVFLGNQVIGLATRWWKALDVSNGLKTLAELLGDVGHNLSRTFEDVKESADKPCVALGSLVGKADHETGPGLGQTGSFDGWIYTVRLLGSHPRQGL